MISLSWDLLHYPENKTGDFGDSVGNLVVVEDPYHEMDLYGVVIAEAIFFDDPKPYLYAWWEYDVGTAKHMFGLLTQEEVEENLIGESPEVDIYYVSMAEVTHYEILETGFNLPANVDYIPTSIPNAYDVRVMT